MSDQTGPHAIPRRRAGGARAIALIGTLALLVGFAVRADAARAQQPNPTTVQPGTAAIWTDKTQYLIGDTINYCWTIPVAGTIQITDYPADGSAQVIFTGTSGTTGCQTGVVLPPPGTECLKLTFPLPPGTGQTQTCFQVVGTSPPPPSSGASISTNRPSYQIGDPIQVCYSVPGPGYVNITNTLADGTTQPFVSGYDDGTGACIPGTVTPPPGTECLTLNWTSSTTFGTATAGAQTCFQVAGTPPPPSGYIFVGNAPIQADGSWAFYMQTYPPQPGLTYVRVTSGGCTDSPAEVAVWEGNMTPEAVYQPGLQVFEGNLFGVGNTAITGTSGYGYIAVPMVQYPPATVSLTLYGIPPAYQGINLNVCVRTP
jgi:hypothetical protein